VSFLKKEKYKIVLKNLSKEDREIVDKINKEFVQDRVEKDDPRKITDDLGEEIDVNNMQPEVHREAVLKLQFGKLKDMTPGIARPMDTDPAHLFADYQQYFEKGSTEFFQINKDLVFGFIKKDTFLDSFKFDADWKVRYLALEEIYLGLCKIDKLKNDQQWNINKFVYIQLNCGIRMEFLDSYRTSRTIKLSIKDHRDGFAALEGQAAGSKYKRPLRKYYDATGDAYIGFRDIPLGAAQSVNPPKIDIILLLISQRAISYRSGIVLEPILRLLCLEVISVRRMAFDILANLQRVYKAKKKTLIQLYMLALKFPNWLLRAETLRLICLALYGNNDDIGVGAEDFVLAVAALLDDDSNRVKMYPLV